MGLNRKNTFVRKPYSKSLYKWSPPESDKKAQKTSQNGRGFFCDAKALSNGEDWITTYVYNIEVATGGIQQRIAYVACDYVK